MNTFKSDLNKNLTQGISKTFHQVDDNRYYIDSPTILTDNHLVTKNEIFELLDFPTPDMQHTYFKLLDVMRKGYKFYLVGLDLRTGEMISRYHRLDCPKLPCSWLILSIDSFEKEPDMETVQTYCYGKYSDKMYNNSIKKSDKE